ncbi:hypothetical protein Avbf_07273 [Armadillidium vulgare]|nr:hypothetical protein Avbf_07273 [Armadillidium vulgare]
MYSATFSKIQTTKVFNGLRVRFTIINIRCFLRLRSVFQIPPVLLLSGPTYSPACRCSIFLVLNTSALFPAPCLPLMSTPSTNLHQVFLITLCLKSCHGPLTINPSNISSNTSIIGISITWVSINKCRKLKVDIELKLILELDSPQQIKLEKRTLTNKNCNHCRLANDNENNKFFLDSIRGDEDVGCSFIFVSYRIKLLLQEVELFPIIHVLMSSKTKSAYNAAVISFIKKQEITINVSFCGIKDAKFGCHYLYLRLYEILITKCTYSISLSFLIYHIIYLEFAKLNFFQLNNQESLVSIYEQRNVWYSHYAIIGLIDPLLYFYS